MSSLNKLAQTPSTIWVIFAGIATGFGCRAGATGFLWLIALFPLFIVFDRICHNSQLSWKQKFGRIGLACWLVGSLCASIAVPFMTHAIHVFGHLPKVVAIFITVFLYGWELALAFLILFGLPLLAMKRWEGWDIPVRIMFFLVIEPVYPKFFPWSVGKFVFSQVPWIAQSADLVGSSALGGFALGSNCLLLMLWRQKLRPSASQQFQILPFGTIYAILLILGVGYGGWRTTQIQAELAQGEPFHIAAIQPNFSLQQLASNPSLAFSKRQNNIQALLQDSEQALARLPKVSSIPRLTVWPESVYPFAYFKDPSGRQLVEQFAQEHNTAVLLTSVDWDYTESGHRQFYGVSLLVGADGTLKGRYNKIYLMPFGEFIPGADLFPAYRQWLRELVPNISEFVPGKEFTVFQLSDTVQFSGAICFDAFSAKIMRKMVQNGAKLIVNLSNLAWFGKTNASQHMELILRWHAIENRVPFLYISNNGETMFLNFLGENSSPTVGLFEQGSLSETLLLKTHFSFYREYQEWTHASMVILLLMAIILGQKRGKIFIESH